MAFLGDTIHNFADALTAVVARHRLPARPASAHQACYTYGYGRSEDLAGILVVATIALSSAVVAWEPIQRLLDPWTVHNIAWVVVAGLVGFAGNELVAIYRAKVGRKIGSASVVADGLHARTDVLTSLAVVLGALGVAAGWQLADPVVGLAGRRSQRVPASVPGVQAVEGVCIRWIGDELRAEGEIVSDADLSLAEAPAIAEEAHHRLLHDIRRLGQATIHASPCGHDGRDHHATTAHHLPHVAAMPARCRSSCIASVKAGEWGAWVPQMGR